jgi:ATPase subunit of ABC transporter with duplicated ATPase domains
MISVSGLEKSFGAQTLFSGVSFLLNPGEKYGLVGANGSGKTTLLNILIGTESPSGGTVAIAKSVKLGVLRQDQFLHEDQPILDVVMMGNRELWEAMAEKERILANSDKEFDADRYAELEDVVLRHDGYAAEARAAEILEGLGIPGEQHDQPLSTLSGGFKLRVLLAQALAGNPDALLLDEPTNHLDILSIRWLEKFLQEFTGVVVVISHDHRFLDNVCTQILDVDYETVTLYPGNYTRFVEAKAEERDRRGKEISKREKEIAHHQQFVDRFRAKASKARQAQSKLRLIEKRAEGLEKLPETSRRYPNFRFKQRRPSGRETLKVEGIRKSYDDKEVLHGVDLVVRRGDRVAILGPNGIGKSTLLKIVMGELEPDAGEVEWGYETYPGYFAQDHRAHLSPPDQTAEAWVADFCAGETISFVRGQLGRVLFSGDEAEKRLGSLSGGEAARLIFCRLAIEQPNVLVLDEPTNHLDLESIEALVGALRDYDGTLIFVSHDRWFVEQLASRIVEIKPGEVLDYAGTYEEYVHYCGDDHLDVDTVVLKAKKRRKKDEPEAASAAVPRSRRPSPGQGKQVHALRTRRDEIVARIESDEKAIAGLNEVFADPATYEGKPAQELQQLQEKLGRLQAGVEKLTEEWESIEAELEELT